MKNQHIQLASGRWSTLSFLDQMANIGSEVIRANNWKKKGNQEYATLAFYRALELVSYSLEDKKNKTRLKEISRMHEVLADYFAGDNIYNTKEGQLNKEFYSFTYAASLEKQKLMQNTTESSVK